MGALPKNKITRAERGKRRSGNTPSLKKDPKISSIPLHKRGLVNSILAATGLKDVKAEGSDDRGSKKSSRKATQPAATSPEASQVQSTNQTKATVATGRKTQHKG